MAQPQFSVEAIISIQEAWDNRTIDVRACADLYDVTPETIRRIGRRDTYRHVGRPTTAQDHRTVGKATSAISDAEIEASLARLRERMQKERPADPMTAGGMDDPGEGAVLP